MKKTLLFAWLLAICANVALSQSGTGLPPFGSLSGGSFDTVNQSSLNVYFPVPIFHRPGRGIPFSYDLTYNSNFYTQVDNGMGQKFWSANNWGWGSSSQALAGSLTYSTQYFTCANSNEYYKYTSFVYWDAQGTAHSFAGTATDQSLCSPPSSTNLNQVAAHDGSGYLLSFTASTEAATVFGPSGQVIVPSEPDANHTPPSPSVKDSNGNQSTTTGSVFTDTLGTTALTVTQNGLSSATYAYPAPSGSKSVTVNYSQYNVRTNFGCLDQYSNPVGEFVSTGEYLVSSITLADGTSYGLTYEPTPGSSTGEVTGRIHSVTLPSGGTFTYTYSGGNNGINCSDGTPATLTRATPDGSWTYAHTAPAVGSTSAANSTTITDPKTNRTILNFQQIYETSRQVYTGSATLLETVQTCYNGAAFPCDSTAIALSIGQRTTHTTLPGGPGTAETDTYLTGAGLPTEVDEYDFGASSPTRKTTTQYCPVATCSTMNNNIVDRPYQVTVQNGSGTTISQTTYTYDEGTPTTSGSPQLVGVSGSRGNPTTIAISGQNASSMSEKLTYFDNGNVRTSTDFSGDTTNRQTTYTYGACGNSFLTSVALPMSLSRSQAWDCNGGVITSTTDENQQPTSYYHTDPNYWRVTQITKPPSDGGQVTYTYNLGTTLPWNIVTSTKINSSTSRTTETVYDGLGRVAQTQLTSDPDGTTYVDRSYDGDGLLYSVSNPHRSGSNPTDGTAYYTYDGLGRPTKLTQPDGSSSINLNYSANCVTTTDEASHARQTCSDGLGRLSKVLEPDNNNNLNIETDYTYDVLNDLTGVSLHGQSRSFAFDGLGRKTSETVPESGTTYYYYTPSGGGLCSGDPREVCR